MFYKKNEITKAVVTGITDYGVFVLLDNKHSGLIHISQIDNKFINNINDYVEIDEEIYCQVLEEDNKRINLSIKDIDYRNSGKKRRIDSQEFKILKDNLNKWVEDKLKEIENN